MGAGTFISRRLGFKGLMVTVSVAVSFFVIIVAVAVAGGFRKEIRDGVAAITGDISLSGQDRQFTFDSPAFAPDEGVFRSLSSIPGVRSVEPVIARPGIIKVDTEIVGVTVKGVLRSDTTFLGVSIPSSLSRKLGIGPGDEMVTWFVDYSPDQEENARTSVRKFIVTQVHPEPFEMKDAVVVYARIEDMRRLLRYGEDEINSLEIMIDSPMRTRDGYASVKSAAEEIVYGDDGLEDVMVGSAPDMYPALFDWLDLLDFNVVVVLILMIIVSGFNMISGLLIMMFRNISTIGTLKALGMTDRSLAGVFFRVSARKVLWGMLLGNIAAFVFCAVQHFTHLIRLNPANYYVDYVPVSLDPLYLLVAELVAAVIILLLVSLPVLFVSKVDPAETVKVK